MARILIIDDQSAICDLLVTVLTTRGHEVLVASNGAQGLQAFAAHRPDVVVTDLNLPGMDGLEVIARLKREHPEVPVIAMSGGFGTDTDHYLEVVAEFGAATVLRKPFHLAAFLQAVDRALGARRPAEASAEPFAALPELIAV